MRLGTVAIVCASLAGVASAQVVHVDGGATGANDGSSWPNAYVRLETALAAASSGAQVWVAEGVYKPSTTGDVAQSFVVPSGVAVYGGFAGTEASLAERVVAAHPTILSGDLAGDTGASFQNLDDNSRHVVRLSGVSASTRLDGLILENGYARSPESSGGGIVLIGGTPVIEGCILRFNVADSFGAGLYANGQPTLRGCVVHDNGALEGGGLDLEAGGVIDRSRFVHNTVFGSGAGLWAIGSLQVTSCVFAGNVATSASAIDCKFPGGGNPSSVRNSTFFANSGTDVGGAGQVPLLNCILSSEAANARYADPLGLDGVAGTLDDDLRLLPDSPFRDAGDNAHVTATMLLDVAGLPRRVDDPDTTDTGSGSAPIVDRGAHEYQPCAAPTTTCAGAPNSVGPGAVLSFVGSPHLYAHDMRFVSSGLPPNAIGLFFHGDQSIQVPFGNGYRCVGGTVARIGIVSGNAGGMAQIAFDPAGSSVPIAAGDVRYFQHWYRNPAAGGAGFNLSDGVRVVFCE